MTRHHWLALTFTVLVATLVPLGRAQAQSQTPPAPDISGTFTAAIDTQVGVFKYTYVFKAAGAKLTGTADNGQGSKSDLTAGKIDGKTVTFVENLKYMEMDIVVTYTGTIVSADEIKFSRQVGEFATEEFVAKRAKP